MFAANAKLEFGLHRATTFAAHANEFADAVTVDRNERVLLIDAALLINLEETGSVVARNASSTNASALSTRLCNGHSRIP